MKKRAKIITGVVVVGVLALLVTPRFFRKAEVADPATPPVVRAETPKTGSVTLYRELTGTVEPSNMVSVIPKLAGEVMEVHVKTGDHVQQGQALLTIDNRQLESARITMETARVSLADAQTNLARMQALYNSGDISAQAYEQVVSAATQAQLQYDAAKLNYDTQAEFTTITAPIAGVIESFSPEVHDMISQTAPVCVISGGEGMSVSFAVPEKIAAGLAPGDPLKVEKGGSEYEGSITEVSTMVNASTGLFDVKGAVPAAQGLATGTTVKLSVISDQAVNVMTLPVDTIYYEGGDAYVYTYEDGIVHKVPVEVGIYDSEMAQILSGVDGSTMVLTTWNSELYDGAPATLEEAPAAGGASDAGQTDEAPAAGGETETAAAENEAAADAAVTDAAAGETAADGQ